MPRGDSKGTQLKPRTGKRAAKAQVLTSEVLFHGRVFELRRDRVAEPSGIEATREFIVHPGSVVVIPVFPDRRILLIRQYRHAAGQYLWELVAGHKEPNETVVEGARRELLEEAGYHARRVRKLLEIFPSPGFLSERMDIFVAEGLTKGQSRPEDDEKISSRILRLPEILRWIRSGKIRDAKTISGILFYATFARRR